MSRKVGQFQHEKAMKGRAEKKIIDREDRDTLCEGDRKRKKKE